MSGFVDDAINKIGDAIKAFFLGLINFSWVPEIWIWYWWLFVFFLFCGAVIWFFGWSKVVRVVTSMAFLAAAIFVAGGRYMAKRIAAREKKSDGS